jgi:hypothetical protein
VGKIARRRAMVIAVPGNFALIGYGTTLDAIHRIIYS